MAQHESHSDQKTLSSKPKASFGDEEKKTNICYVLYVSEKQKGKKHYSVAVQPVHSKTYGDVLKPLSKSFMGYVKRAEIFQKTIAHYFGNKKIENIKYSELEPFDIMCKDCVRTIHVLIIQEEKFTKINGTVHFVDFEKLLRVIPSRKETNLVFQKVSRSVLPSFYTALRRFNAILN